MSSRDRTELLEARAERGTRRGADAVWRNATAAAGLGADQDPGPRFGGFGSSGWFRLAVGVFAVAMVAAIGFTVDRDRTDTAEPITTGPAEEDEDGNEDGNGEVSESGESPRRILIDDMEMSWFQGPADPDFAGDDDFLDRARIQVTGSDAVVPMSPDDESIERMIFADPTDPFENPILGVDLLDGGGFRPWGMNLGDMPLEQLSESLNRTDGEWTVGEDSGLVEVARFSGEPYNLLRFGWQFDFRSGADGATLQAERHEGAGVWLWMARIAGSSTERITATVTEVSVLDQPGILVEQSFGTDPSTDLDQRSSVFWVDEDFVYRLTADRTENNTVFNADAIPLLPRLRIVDDATWDAQVANANSGGPPGDLLALVDVTLLGLWVVSSVYFLIFRPRFLAPSGVVAVGFWVVYGVSLLSTVILVAGLVALWLWRRRWLRTTRVVEQIPVGSERV